MKHVLLMLMMTSLIACDKSVQLTINKETVYSLDNPCGKIEFRASTFSKWITIYQNFKMGEYKINFDSLKVLIDPPGTFKIDTIKFYEKNSLLTNVTKKATKPSDQISVYLIFNEPVYTFDGTILILPCSYLTCDKQPIINDTIRINL